MRGSRHTRAMAIMGLLSLAAAPAATGQELSSRAYHFGAVGLGPGQAVRVTTGRTDGLFLPAVQKFSLLDARE